MKTVAIVGNSANLLNTEFGENIDSCNRIIRFNRCEIEGYEPHVGCRYDIYMSPYFWVLPLKGLIFFEKFREFWFMMPVSLKKEWYEGPDIESAIKTLNKPVKTLTKQQKKLIQTEVMLDDKNPSTGLAAIYMCFHYLPEYRIKLFGFDSYKTGLYFDQHVSFTWRDIGSKRRLRRHHDKEDNDWSLEHKHITNLIQQDLIDDECGYCR